MNRHYLFTACFLLLFLSGCTSNFTQGRNYLNEAFEAESFTQQGLHKQAAYSYQALARNKPARQIDYNLLAAEAYSQSGDSLAAQSITNAIKPNLLTPKQRAKFNLVLIQIALSNGETEKALGLFNKTQVYNLNHADQITFYQSLAFTHSLMGKPLHSVQARTQLTPLLDPQKSHENNKVILDTLFLLPTKTLSLQQPPSYKALGGWMALAKILKRKKSTHNATEYQLALDEWRQFFPQHPANAELIQSFSEPMAVSSLHNTFTLPTTLAILLPESGRFAKAAATIKSGFMAAYQQSASDFQPSIRFYDSSNNNSVNLYHQAISEGAELVIGPLSKNKIEELALGTELTVPVLALNHVPNLVKSNLFQFGLSPIDAAKQLATQASSKGFNNILILAAESKRGHRSADYLSNYWQATGGTVLETQYYNTKGGDFSKSIKNLLNINESESRYKKINRFLSRGIEHVERRRTDVDAIFLSASAKKARSIYPQLQFYRATQVPVFASPQIYSGQVNPAADRDLNSITFCDIPWLFPEIYSGALSQESLQANWQGKSSSHLRLVALGIDSFNIISKLENITNEPYAGATGTLSLNMENRITRQLVCAKFIKGRPVLQNTANDGF